MTSKSQYYGYYKMVKKQKYIITIILSFIFLLILSSFISFQKNTYYHNLNGDYYISITEKYIQPFYNNISLFVWCIGFIFLSLFTYIFFRNYDDPVYKKYLVDYKLLFKTAFVFILIFYFIGIFGEIFPGFSVSDPEIKFISQTEYEEKININEINFDVFNMENWIEI